MNLDAVIVAAGSSTRFGGADKLFADLCGTPVIAWSLSAFEQVEAVDRIFVVTNPANFERVRAIGRAVAPARFAEAVPGGARRRDSVEAGLRVATSRYVAIHDGARPLVTIETIAACIAAAEGKPGAIVAVPVTDTIKEVREGMVIGHPERTMLWAAQTPQVVLRRAWLDAAQTADDDETDDAAMLARFGLETAVVPGDAANLKITRLLDLEIATAVLRSRGVTACA